MSNTYSTNQGDMASVLNITNCMDILDVQTWKTQVHQHHMEKLAVVQKGRIIFTRAIIFLQQKLTWEVWWVKKCVLQVNHIQNKANFIYNSVNEQLLVSYLFENCLQLLVLPHVHRGWCIRCHCHNPIPVECVNYLMSLLTIYDIVTYRGQIGVVIKNKKKI